MPTAVSVMFLLINIHLYFIKRVSNIPQSSPMLEIRLKTEQLGTEA